MYLIHGDERRPGRFEEAFIATFPALELRATSRSGGRFGDGDARPAAIDYDRLQFAMECKERYSKKWRRNLVFLPDEYDKALRQLRRHNPYAIRLLVVYNGTLRAYAVAIPEQDLAHLPEALRRLVQGWVTPEGELAEPALGAPAVTLRTARTQETTMVLLTAAAWASFYDALADYRAAA